MESGQQCGTPATAGKLNSECGSEEGGAMAHFAFLNSGIGFGTREKNCGKNRDQKSKVDGNS